MGDNLGRQERLVSAAPRGSARSMDYTFAPTWLNITGDAAFSNDVVDRPGQARNTMLFGVGGGGAGTQWGFNKGRAAYKLVGAAGSTGVIAAGSTFRAGWKTVVGGGAPLPGDPADYACWRFAAVLAWDAAANNPVATDFGFGIGPAFNGDVFQANTLGMMIQPRS